jgi:protein involved in polysaccharide export with SLBB domain
MNSTAKNQKPRVGVVSLVKYFAVKTLFATAFIVAFTFSTEVKAQTASEIEMAKQLAKQQGYSDSQIDAMLKKQGGNQQQGGTKTTVPAVDRNSAAVQQGMSGYNNGQFWQNGKNNQNGINQNGQNQNGYFQNGMNGYQQGMIQYDQNGNPIDLKEGYFVKGLDGKMVFVKTKEQIFGHNIFKNADLNFVPSYNIPTPETYKLSAGDEVVIDVWGDVVTNITATVSPEGAVTIPDVGPVYLQGQTIKKAENSLRDYLSRIYSGISTPTPTTFVKISLGKIRSFSINVLGEVMKPGTYTLPSLSTMASALYLAGGPTDIGTIREIKLYRRNKLISVFDVYEFITEGKFSTNVRLEDNDVIIVSPYTNVVTVSGAVKRPMRYEMKANESLTKLLKYSGSFADSANVSFVHIDRIKSTNEKYRGGAVAQSFDVPAVKFGEFHMEDGDVVTINKNVNRFKNRVVVTGAVWYPGTYSISDKVKTVKQLLQSAGGVTDEAYMDRAYVVRLGAMRQREQISFNLTELILGKVQDIPLMPDDSLKIFDFKTLEAKRTIAIDGEVNSPSNKLEYRDGMTVGDAILMGGGTTHAATLSRVEVFRRIDKDGVMSISGKVDVKDTVALVLKFNLLQKPNDASVKLKPFDVVYVYRSALYKPQQAVMVQGEILYPGKYVVEKNVVRLSDIIERAKGFTNDAYVKGAKLTRVLTREEVDRLKIAMSIAKKQRADSTALDSLEIGDRYNIAIDLGQAMANPGTVADIILREGDIITVPKFDNTVKVSGAVLYPNTISYDPNTNYKYYIENSGGYATGAIKRKVYMVHMNGAVAAKGSKNFEVRPGTEIVVPMRDLKNDKRMTLAEVMGLASSTASIAAIVISITKL